MSVLKVKGARPRRPAPDATTAVLQAAALLLGYPDREWPARLAAVHTALADVPGPQAELLRGFCSQVRDVPPMELAARYVTTFDRSRRRTLHLTYYTDGDTRRRGGSLAGLKARYRRQGWEVAGGELPDFLPAALEFAARCPREGVRVLREHRAGLELLGHALETHRSPYADVLRAVRDSLPGPATADRREALRLARNGPPAESVGLEPFGAAPATPPATPPQSGPSDPSAPAGEGARR